MEYHSFMFPNLIYRYCLAPIYLLDCSSLHHKYSRFHGPTVPLLEATSWVEKCLLPWNWF